jgi:hypothetical protein
MGFEVPSKFFGQLLAIRPDEGTVIKDDGVAFRLEFARPPSGARGRWIN